MNNWRLLGLVIGLIAVCYGLWGIYQRHIATSGIVTRIEQSPVSIDGAEPDETPVDMNQNYDVPANQPRRIIIPKISVDGFVQSVGVTEENKVESPTNIHVAGWYNEGPVPGNQGVSLIDGHYSGRYSDGIFKHLARLQQGDRFNVEFGDLSQETFEVIRSQNYGVEEASYKMLAAHPDAPQQLNLITCSGAFDSEANSYDERTLVIARLTDDSR